MTYVHLERRRWLARAGWVISALLLVACAAAACSSNNAYYSSCSGPTSFQVFQAGDISAIPLCDDSTTAIDAEIPDGDVEAGFLSYSNFAGAPRLTAAALAQCQSACVTSNASTPCCISQWQPQTVVCPPACQ